MSDLKVAALLGALCLPYLIWVNFQSLRRGEFYLDDDVGKITDYVKRSDRPFFYWVVMAINFGLIFGFLYLVVWQLVVLKAH